MSVTLCSMAGLLYPNYVLSGTTGSIMLNRH